MDVRLIRSGHGSILMKCLNLMKCLILIEPCIKEEVTEADEGDGGEVDKVEEAKEEVPQVSTFSDQDFF